MRRPTNRSGIDVATAWFIVANLPDSRFCSFHYNHTGYTKRESDRLEPSKRGQKQGLCVFSNSGCSGSSTLLRPLFHSVSIFCGTQKLFINTMKLLKCIQKENCPTRKPGIDIGSNLCMSETALQMPLKVYFWPLKELRPRSRTHKSCIYVPRDVQSAAIVAADQ